MVFDDFIHIAEINAETAKGCGEVTLYTRSTGKWYCAPSAKCSVRSCKGSSTHGNLVFVAYCSNIGYLCGRLGVYDSDWKRLDIYRRPLREAMKL